MNHLPASLEILLFEHLIIVRKKLVSANQKHCPSHVISKELGEWHLDRKGFVDRPTYEATCCF